MKKLFTTKTLVATGLGTALFLVFFMYVKVPSPVPNTNFQIAYAISSFFGALFGPVCSAIIAFAGHALNDTIAYGACWWSWIIASGVAGFIQGTAFTKMHLEEGKGPRVSYYIWNIAAHAVAWLVVSPILDVVIYGEEFKLVFLQGVTAFFMNTFTTLIVGGILTTAYAKSRVGKGTLDKE